MFSCNAMWLPCDDDELMFFFLSAGEEGEAATTTPVYVAAIDLSCKISKFLRLETF